METVSRASARRHVRVIMPDRELRAKLDHYRTPKIAIDALLSVETFPGRILEPGCGTGTISRALKVAGSRVTAHDIVYRGYGRGDVDFLTYRPRNPYDHIVMNPPFTHAFEFIEHAFTMTTGKVAVLLRLLWLEGRARGRWYREHPPVRIWVSSQRWNVSREGFRGRDDGTGGMVAFAWFVWDLSKRTRNTQIGWV